MKCSCKPNKILGPTHLFFFFNHVPHLLYLKLLFIQQYMCRSDTFGGRTEQMPTACFTY